MRIATRIVRWSIDPRGAARGLWSERTAVVIGIADDRGATGLGEAAPLPGMSIETIAETIEDLRRAVTELPAAAVGLVEHIACRATADAPRRPVRDARRVEPTSSNIAASSGHAKQPAPEIARALEIAERVTTTAAARFAIETALLVLLAQQRRSSVAALWGVDDRRALQCAVVVDDPEEARIAAARGARCLKIKGGDPAQAARISRAAPEARLRIDANRSWPRSDVIDRLAALAGLPIDFVEEPCVDAHELLAAPLPCRIALDESLASLGTADLSRALRSPDLAALVLKPTLLGGFARCLELAELARHHGVAPIISHALEGPIGTAACFELARVIGGDIAIGLAPHPGIATFAEAA